MKRENCGDGRIDIFWVTSFILALPQAECCEKREKLFIPLVSHMKCAVVSKNKSQQVLSETLYSWNRPQYRGIVLQALRDYAASIDDTNCGPETWSDILTVAKMDACVADAEMFTSIAHALAAIVCRPCNASYLTGNLLNTVEKVFVSAEQHNYPCALYDSVLCVLQCALRQDNAIYFVDAVPALTRCLRKPDPPLQQATCSAFHAMGGSSLVREAFVSNGGCSAVLALLYSSSNDVVFKAISAIHAFSIDLAVCCDLRVRNGIFTIVDLLRDEQNDKRTMLAAIGALQNICRDRESVSVVVACKAVDLLVPFVFCIDAELQGAAIGAVLNLHQGGPETREALKRLVHAAVVEQIVEDVVATEVP